MKIRIQAGVEQFQGGKRRIRITPIDQSVVIAEPAASILIAVASQVDGNDAQPGDGDIDFPLDKVPQAILGRLPGLAALMGDGDSNAFIRIKSA